MKNISNIIVWQYIWQLTNNEEFRGKVVVFCRKVIHFSIYPTYNRKLTTSSQRPPTMMPKMPPMLLRPIRPNEIENAKISRNNQSELHHFASFAAKHTTNHSTPALEHMMLARPNGRLFPVSDKLFKIRDCLSCCIIFADNAAVEPCAAGTLVSNSWFSRRFVPGRSSWLNCRILSARSAGRTLELSRAAKRRRLD